MIQLTLQVEDSAATQRSVDWSPNKSATQGGGGDESSSATNSVVEEWLLSTADEQISHFDEGSTRHVKGSS